MDFWTWSRPSLALLAFAAAYVLVLLAAFIAERRRWNWPPTLQWLPRWFGTRIRPFEVHWVRNESLDTRGIAVDATYRSNQGAATMRSVALRLGGVTYNHDGSTLTLPMTVSDEREHRAVFPVPLTLPEGAYRAWLEVDTSVGRGRSETREIRVGIPQ